LLYLFIAYAYAVRWSTQATAESERDLERSLRIYGRSIKILSKRLQDGENRTSDINVQTVLLLIAYTSDFGGAEELHTHIEALRAMIGQRGGLDSFSKNPVLYQQLVAIDFSGKFHLTLGCDLFCAHKRRFSRRIWPSSATLVAPGSPISRVIDADGQGARFFWSSSYDRSAVVCG